MKVKTVYLAVLLFTLMGWSKSADIEVYFSPEGGCTQKIVDLISHSESSIYCVAYSFTSKPIVDALITAHLRGVKVFIVVDKSQKNGKGSQVKAVYKAGIPIWIDEKHAIQHNKVMVFDESSMITGSFNFTNNAEYKNAENMVVVTRDPESIGQYISNWELHKSHSVKYEEK